MYNSIATINTNKMKPITTTHRQIVNISFLVSFILLILYCLLAASGILPSSYTIVSIWLVINTLLFMYMIIINDTHKDLNIFDDETS